MSSPESFYTEETVELPPGSTRFLYTDGLNEAADPDETEFGNDRLRSLFLAQRDVPLTSIPRASSTPSRPSSAAQSRRMTRPSW